MAASQANASDPLKLLFVDVKRALVYARAERDVFVRLPPEDIQHGYCCKLLKAMYGTRDAPALWENVYAQRLTSEGFIRGGSTSLCVHLFPVRLTFPGAPGFGQFLAEWQN